MAGWFKSGKNDNSGHRSLEEQMLGLKQALELAKGKTVLDLGCAEGLISREFAKAGASLVLGVEAIKKFVKAAVELCRGYSNVSFILANLDDKVNTPVINKYDIVLALAIIHKAHNPIEYLQFSMDSCAAEGLLVIRYPVNASNGILKSKHTNVACDVAGTLASSGFTMAGKYAGPRGEEVEYWRKG